MHPERPSDVDPRRLMGVEGVETRTIEAGGIRLHCYIAGQGYPLLLLHGHGGAATIWRRNIQAFAEAFRVYAPDLPGHGLSLGPRIEYTLEAAVKALLGLMESEGIRQAHVVGQSLGGMIGLRLALDHPERVKRLVLVGMPGLGREIAWPLRVASLPLMGPFFSRPSRARLHHFYRTYFFHDASLATDDFIERSFFYRRRPGSTRALVRMIQRGVSPLGQRRSHSFMADLPSLTVPTLLAWGAEDRIIPVAHAHAAQYLIPNCRLHIFDGCGHCPPYERPDEFNQVVLEFLSQA